MKHFRTLSALIGFMAFVFVTCSSCDRVPPNYMGVLMQNYGKNGRSDYALQRGRVWTAMPGTELFVAPLWDQRAQFDSILHLKAADNTQLFAAPKYSFRIIADSAVNVVFSNAQLGSGDDFIKGLEDNVLEPEIYDVMKETSRRFTTDSLMKTGGNLHYEQVVEDLVRMAFKKRGLELIILSCNLDFTDAVKNKINLGNEVATNISVLERQLVEQDLKNKLALKKAQENVNLTVGISDAILKQQFIDKWDGKTPLYGTMPISLFKKE